MKTIKYLISWTILALWGGCQSEYNFDAMNLDEAMVKDYALMAKNNAHTHDISPGTLAYALLMPAEPSQEIAWLMDDEMRVMYRQMAALRDLSPKFVFADPTRHQQWIKNLENSADEIAASLANLSENRQEALVLAKELEKFIRPPGDIAGQLQAYEGAHVPAQARREFAFVRVKLSTSFETLYQLSVLLAQAQPQDVALKGLKGVDTALKALAGGPATNPIVQNAINMADKVRADLALMTSLVPMKDRLQASVISLKQALEAVERNYVEKIVDIAERDEARLHYHEAEHSFKSELKAIAQNYGPADDLKNPANRELNALVTKAFEGPLALLPLIVSSSELKNNDRANLTRMVMSARRLGLKREEGSEELIKALGMAVEKNIAQAQGLDLRNVIGLNYAKINEAKNSLELSDQQFAAYLGSLAKKIYAARSHNDEYAILYVIDATRLGKGAHSKDLAAIFAQGKSRVIIIADEPEIYSPDAIFRPRGLGLIDGFKVAKAVIKAASPSANAAAFAEPVVKIFFSLKSQPEQMNLLSLPTAVKNTLLRVQEAKLKDASPAHIISAATDTLAADPPALPVELVQSSGLLLDSFISIEANMQGNASYYQRGSQQN